MKKLFAILSVMFIGWNTANAMPYEEARDRARFLTDKMAYELNLNDAQYNDAYEINLDYFMNIRTESDLYGSYWTYRNADLRHILYDWQYSLFTAADYFFRPVLWRANAWFFPIYGLYRVNHFYYNPPRVYHVYHGGHYAHHHHHNMSYYAHRRPAWNGGFRGDSRGPVVRHERRSTPAHRDNGFRFERNNRLSPGQNSGNAGKEIGRGERNSGKNNGFRIESPNRQNGKPQGKSDAVQKGNDKQRPQATPARSNRSERVSTPSRSTYNRPSSTRTTVNRSTPRTTTSTPRMSSPGRSNSHSVQRSSARPAGNNRAAGHSRSANRSARR